MTVEITVFSLLVIIIMVGGIIASIKAMQQRKGVIDSNAGRLTRKYLLIASPIFLLYVSFAAVFMLVILYYSLIYE